MSDPKNELFRGIGREKETIKSFRRLQESSDLDQIAAFNLMTDCVGRWCDAEELGCYKAQTSKNLKDAFGLWQKVRDEAL